MAYTCSCYCNCQTQCTCNTVCSCYCAYTCTCNCDNCTVNQNAPQELPWNSSTVSTGVTADSIVYGAHLTEMYNQINEERARRDQAAFSWSYYSVAGNITANQWNEMVTKMNTWLSFTLTHTAGANITSSNIVALRNHMITIAAQCYCNCNRTADVTCSCYCQCNNVCNCQYVCGCNCAYTCTCNCNYSDYNLKKNVEYM